MKFELTFNLDNKTSNKLYRKKETKAILELIGYKVLHNEQISGYIGDSNGNNIGSWQITDND